MTQAMTQAMTRKREDAARTTGTGTGTGAGTGTGTGTGTRDATLDAAGLPQATRRRQAAAHATAHAAAHATPSAQALTQAATNMRAAMASRQMDCSARSTPRHWCQQHDHDAGRCATSRVGPHPCVMSHTDRLCRRDTSRLCSASHTRTKLGKGKHYSYNGSAVRGIMSRSISISSGGSSSSGSDVSISSVGGGDRGTSGVGSGRGNGAVDAESSHPLPNLMPLWVWCHYLPYPPRFITLNLKLLRWYARDVFELREVNVSSIARWLPDLPRTFWELPHQIAFSDVARAALLFRYGGLWVDADFVVVRSLSPFAERLRAGFRLVAYEVDGQKCGKGSLSQNFMASHRNTTYWRTVWQQTERELARRCPGGGGVQGRQLGEASSRRCSGGKYDWGPLLRHPIARKLARDHALDPIFCFSGMESLAPSVSRGGASARVKLFDVPISRLCTPSLRVGCCEPSGDDLICHSKSPPTNSAVCPRFFGRMAYHLFESIHGSKLASERRIEDAGLVASLLYSRALASMEARDRGASAVGRETLLAHGKPNPSAGLLPHALSRKTSHAPSANRNPIAIRSDSHSQADEHPSA